MSHTQAGTIVAVADGTTLPVNRCGKVEVGLDQPGTTTKPVKMVSVAYALRRLQNQLSTRKAAEQWGKSLVSYETKAVLGFPPEECLVFIFYPRKGLFYATGVRQNPSQETALGWAAKTAEAMRIEATGQWGACADVRRGPIQGAVLSVAAKAHDIMEVHRVFAHPSEKIAQKTIQAMRIVTTGQWGACETVKWVDGSDKTGSNGVGDDEHDEKSDEDELVGNKGRRSSTYRSWRRSSYRIPISGHRKRHLTSRRRHGRRHRVPRKRQERRRRINRKRYRIVRS